MNQGGEPAHDDYGLPPVDIEIPDDARELDRDVQAYHRELRALRRRERSNRWRAPLRRSGMVVPLMAGCLIVALVAGMVLTMFSANPYLSRFGQSAGTRTARNNPPAADRAGTSSPRPSATMNSSGGSGTTLVALLPRGNISVGGQTVSLGGLKDVALAIVPVNCNCAAAIGSLLAQARRAKVKVYLVGRPGVKLSTLVPGASVDPSRVSMATDAHSTLSRTYNQPGLVIVLVGSGHHATVEPGLNAHRLQQDLTQLALQH